jgi:V/A-type H+-transporting ATPase subunit E
MKTLEKGSDKIKKICEVLRVETLEPAKREADKIVDEAKARASQIVAEARVEAKQLHDAARESIERERTVFQSSLSQAGKQGIESIKQQIEELLFNREMDAMLSQGSSDPELIAKIISSLIAAVERDGIQADLAAVIPDTVPAEAVTVALGQGTVEKLRGKGLQFGSFRGGAQLKWHNKKLTIDMTDEALKELLSQYVRKDFRKLLFGE